VIPPRPSGPHPGAESLYRAHVSPKSAGSAEVLAHAATCAACSAELAALEAFSATPPDPFGGAARRAGAAWDVFSGRPARRPARVPLPALAVAAALALLVGAAVLVRRPTADVERGGSVPAPMSPDGILQAPPEVFRFRVPGTSSVRVSVFDAARSYAWTSPAVASGEPVPFPPKERAKLRPGVVYTWVVLGEGRTLPARTFEIRADAPAR
jgi:hypothetical protein